MSHTVSQEKVDVVLELVKSEIPDFKIAYKEDGYPKKLWFLAVFASVVTWFQVLFRKMISWFTDKEFGDTFKEDFDKNYSNGVLNFVLFAKKRPLTNYNQYTILCHEVQHLLDRKRNFPLWFEISYGVLPFPIGLSNRAHWELRGYTHNMLSVYEIRGSVPSKYRDYISDKLTSGMYFIPFFSKKLARKVVDRVADRIEEEDIRRSFDLDVNFWKELYKSLFS